VSWPDYVIIGIVSISMIISLVRGFAREAMALVVWIAAFWVGRGWVDQAELQLQPWVDSPTARLVIAFVGLFVATLLVGGLLSYLIGLLVDKTGLSGTDRFMGLWFGALRGVLILLAVVFVAGWTPLPKENWWQQSFFLPRLERLSSWSIAFLPEKYQEILNRDHTSTVEELQYNDQKKQSSDSTQEQAPEADGSE